MTDLPVDFSQKPWRPKYIEDETPMFQRWIIFGEWPDGTVDVSSANQDIVVRVPRAVAEQMIAARDAFVDVMVKHLCDFSWPKTAA